jgi:hypothetical protein
VAKLPARFAPGRSSTTPATAARPAAATSAVTAAKPVPAAKSTCARFPWASFVHCQSPSAQFSAIQSRHGFVRIRIYRHFHKSETASLARISIFHNLHSVYLAVCGKSRIQILLGGLERDVPDINVLQGELLNFCRNGRVDFQMS